MKELELVPLCEVVMQVGEVHSLGNGSAGDMMIGDIIRSSWQGERLRAEQRGRAAGDWMTFGSDGSGTPDVRLTLETHDGALIYVSYCGRYTPATGVAYTTPVFRTGDARYAWLNHVQAVGKASFDPETLSIHYPMVYELR